MLRKNVANSERQKYLGDKKCRLFINQGENKKSLVGHFTAGKKRAAFIERLIAQKLAGNMAAAMGRKGGSSRSDIKKAASKENGKKVGALKKKYPQYKHNNPLCPIYRHGGHYYGCMFGGNKATGGDYRCAGPILHDQAGHLSRVDRDIVAMESDLTGLAGLLDRLEVDFDRLE